MDTKCEHVWVKRTPSNPRGVFQPLEVCEKCGVKKEDYEREKRNEHADKDN